MTALRFLIALERFDRTDAGTGTLRCRISFAALMISVVFRKDVLDYEGFISICDHSHASVYLVDCLYES